MIEEPKYSRQPNSAKALVKSEHVSLDSYRGPAICYAMQLKYAQQCAAVVSGAQVTVCICDWLSCTSANETLSSTVRALQLWCNVTQDKRLHGEATCQGS